MKNNTLQIVLCFVFNWWRLSPKSAFPFSVRIGGILNDFYMCFQILPHWSVLVFSVTLDAIFQTCHRVAPINATLSLFPYNHKRQCVWEALINPECWGMKVPYGSNSYSHVLSVFKFTTDKVSLKAALLRPNSKVSHLEHAKLWGRVRLALSRVWVKKCRLLWSLPRARGCRWW